MEQGVFNCRFAFKKRICNVRSIFRSRKWMEYNAYCLGHCPLPHQSLHLSTFVLLCWHLSSGIALCCCSSQVKQCTYCVFIRDRMIISTARCEEWTFLGQIAVQQNSQSHLRLLLSHCQSLASQLLAWGSNLANNWHTCLTLKSWDITVNLDRLHHCPKHHQTQCFLNKNTLNMASYIALLFCCSFMCM